MAVILVTHDLGVVAGFADRVLVMYAGQIVEQGSVSEIFEDPQHPYTWGLLGSIAHIDRERPRRLPSIPGSPPSLLAPPTGCRFHERCPHALPQCLADVELRARLGEGDHLDRCLLDIERKRSARVVDGGIGPPGEADPMSEQAAMGGATAQSGSRAASRCWSFRG